MSSLLNTNSQAKHLALFILSFVIFGEVVAQLKKSYVCVCMEKLADKLQDPLIIKNAADGTRRLFVGEQKGLIHIFHENGTKYPRLFLDISGKIFNKTNYLGERGLLGLAFHPDCKQNRRFFIYYSSRVKPKNPADDHVTRLSEFTASKKDRNVADISSERIIMEIQQPYGNHNGGEILFGDDGYLYLFVGDGGAGGDPRGYAQNTSSLLGKVLRINIDRRGKYRRYTIPRDNPFIGDSTYLPEIYAYGIRNIWRCGKDRGSIRTGRGQGRIMCGDVGQNRFEEVDLIQKGGNYGWNAREGTECFQKELCDKIGPEVLPVFTYPHSVGRSVIGGHFYRGCLNPRMRRFYVFGDYISGKLFRLLENRRTRKWNGKELRICDKNVCPPPLTNKYEPKIMSFGEDESGEIYMVSTGDSSTSGTMYRIVDPKRNGHPYYCKASRTLRQKQRQLKAVNGTKNIKLLDKTTWVKREILIIVNKANTKS